MATAEERCLERASRQEGVIERAQALQLGLTAGRIEVRLRARRWGRLFRSVYCVAGSPESWHQKLRAASLWAARGFAISHRSAAALMGLARFREGPVELSVVRHLRAPGRVRVHQVRALHSRDVRDLRGLRVTSPARTLVDLCATEDPQTLEATADEMLRRRLLTLEQLEEVLSRHAHHRGISFLRDLLERYQGGERPAESELESRSLELIDNAGLPRPTKQKRVMAGGKLRRVDFAYERERVVVEAEGFTDHSYGAKEKDQRRRNAITSKGYRVFVWTWNAVKNEADRLAEDLADALQGPS